MNVRFFVGFALAMGGPVMVGLGSSTGSVTIASDQSSLLGYLLPLLAAIVWAVYSVLVKRIASAACFVTWGVSAKHLGAAISATYIYLVPAITATASIILLGEPLAVPIVTGLALTIAGLVLSQRGQVEREV